MDHPAGSRRLGESYNRFAFSSWPRRATSTARRSAPRRATRRHHPPLVLENSGLDAEGACRPLFSRNPGFRPSPATRHHRAPPPVAHGTSEDGNRLDRRSASMRRRRPGPTSGSGRPAARAGLVSAVLADLPLRRLETCQFLLGGVPSPKVHSRDRTVKVRLVTSFQRSGRADPLTFTRIFVY